MQRPYPGSPLTPTLGLVPRTCLAVGILILSLGSWGADRFTLRSGTKGHIPAENARPLDAEVLDSYSRLFWDLAYRCPTGLQPELLARAETIWSHLHGFHPVPPPPEERDRISDETLRFYGRLRREYPTVQLTWNEEGVRAGAPVPSLELARGLERGVLLEIENRSPADIRLRAQTEGEDAGASAQTIPTGDRRTFVVLARAESTSSRSLGFSLVPTEAPHQAQRIELPTRVREPVRLRGVLREAGERDPWPGRVTVQGSDGQFRYGQAFATNRTLSEKPVVFRPAVYRLPFFYSDGRFEVLVPPGKVEVTLERGFEHTPVTRTLTLPPGASRELTLKSGRFLDMRKRGWISGDTHIHWVTNEWDTNEDLALLSMVQRAEDLRVANNLTLYQWRSPEMGGPFTKPDQFGMGPVPGRCDPHYHLEMAEEYRNDHHYGHLNLLNLERLILPLATGAGSGGPPEAYDTPTNRWAIEEARRQGGISVEAHGLGPYHSGAAPLNVALGLADSLDQLPPDDYYRFLDCGFHIGLTNGSDHPARVVGCARAYVRVDGPFTYERWIEGVRRGRTFTTSGPLLFLRVNETEVGDTLDVTPGRRLRVRAEAYSRHPLGVVEVVSNGEVLKRLRTGARRAGIELELPADRSRWLVARASRTASFDAMSGPDIAHTSALYVCVDGREVVRAEAVRFWLERIRQLEARLLRTARFRTPEEKHDALRYVRDGRTRYEALLRMAAG